MGLPVPISAIYEAHSTVTNIPRGCTGVHESTLRAYMILSNVKWLLSKATPADVVLELIYQMESATKP